MVEANSLVSDIESAANFPEDIQERHHGTLCSAANKNVAASCKRRRAPRGSFNAVSHGGVVITLEPIDSLNADYPVAVYGNYRAHFLQNSDQVIDFWLDRGVSQLGDALGAYRGQYELLGWTH